MRELIACVAALGVLLYLSRDKRLLPLPPKKEMFQLEALQNALNMLHERDKYIYPIDTVYFNDNGNGKFSGRFMFLNTRDFSGVQYDIETDGTQLTSVSKSVPPNYQNPFSGYSKRMDLSGITINKPSSLDMNKIWENYRVSVN
jgi:hypothetical protein